MKSLFRTILLGLLALCITGIVCFSQEYHNCYTIIVGREASASGAVLMAHNEDDHGEQLVNWYKVPAQEYPEPATITLKNGAIVQLPDATHAYLWLEMPGMDFADSYMNAYGVTIASNACRSREQRSDLEQGGIGYGLRRLMILQARTAREAVQIGARLIATYGYYSSGRTYCIADPQEAWMLAVVRGKHWVAQRVPDNKVAVIPNFYTITDIDLDDTLNFLGSSDIIDYARQKKWYHPYQDGQFSFRKAYSDISTRKDIDNKARAWRGINLLSEGKYSLDDPLPFAFEPDRKIAFADLARVLRDHYAGTQFEMMLEDGKNPHQNKINTICAPINQYAFIAQLRDWLPVEVGAVMWIAPRFPCIQPFTPWYFGIRAIPPQYQSGNAAQALRTHFADPVRHEGHAFLELVRFSEKIEQNYAQLIDSLTLKRDIYEQVLHQAQADLEQKFLRMYKNDPGQARQLLTQYTHQKARQLRQQRWY